MPAVKEKAQISHLQNHPDKNLLVRCWILCFSAAADGALWLPCMEGASGELGDRETGSPLRPQNAVLSTILKESRHIAGSILILKLTYIILVITATFKY